MIHNCVMVAAQWPDTTLRDGALKGNVLSGSILVGVSLLPQFFAIVILVQILMLITGSLAWCCCPKGCVGPLAGWLMDIHETGGFKVREAVNFPREFTRLVPPEQRSTSAGYFYTVSQHRPPVPVCTCCAPGVSRIVPSHEHR